MKSILLHVSGDESFDTRLQSALALTRATGGHLSCVHATSAEAYVAFDGFGGVYVMQDVLAALAESESKLRERVEGILRSEGISWDYRQAAGSTANAIVSQAALSDVVFIGRGESQEHRRGAPLALIGDVLCRSRTPLIIPTDDGVTFQPAEPMLIAWDGGYEAANAVRAAIGLLKLASQVEIVRVEEAAEALFPSTRLLEFLSRYEIHAELRTETADKTQIEAVLLSRATHFGATCLVMGGYGHSRVGEYLFGGVTRGLLANAPIALCIAH